jgi:hypothetical protein
MIARMGEWVNYNSQSRPSLAGSPAARLALSLRAGNLVWHQLTATHAALAEFTSVPGSPANHSLWVMTIHPPDSYPIRRLGRRAHHSVPGSQAEPRLHGRLFLASDAPQGAATAPCASLMEGEA